MDFLLFLHDLLVDESKHFLLAVCLGSLGSGLMLTMLYVLQLVVEALTRKQMPTVVVFGMVFISILLGLSLVFFSHVWLDGYVIWSTTPLAPPLNLNTY